MCEKPEKYLTIKEAAYELGLPYYKIQRAARRGDIPSHRLFNNRRYLLISELQACMRPTAAGGAK